MTIGEFVDWLAKNNCQIIVMPDWNIANTLEIINLKNGLRAFLNTNIRISVHPSVVEGICSRLGLGFPSDYV